MLFFYSAIRFLVDEYKADPNTFIYDWSYDTSAKSSLMSKVYIDLGNYLAGKYLQIECNFLDLFDHIINESSLRLDKHIYFVNLAIKVLFNKITDLIMF